MAIVYLGLGSNMRPEQNLKMAANNLRTRFGDIVLSSVYRNKALGFDGDDFLNLVAQIETDLQPVEVVEVLEEIHDLSGRERGCAKFVARPLDIDLLLYDRLIDQSPPARVPRSDVLEYSFVLVPLAEIAADYVHPQTGRKISDHLAEFDKSAHRLTKVALAL